MTPRTLRSRLAGAALPAQAAAVLLAMAAILAVALLLSGRVIGSIEQTRMLVMGANAQAAAVREVVDALKDAETGQRGFLLTGKPAYLEPYWSGRARLEVGLGVLEGVALESPELADDVATLHQLAEQKRTELDRTVDVGRDQGLAPAIDLVRTDFGKATMDAVRGRADAMLQAIERRHATLIDQVRGAERLSSRAAAFASAVGALVLGGALIVLLRAQGGLREARDRLRTQSARLSGTVDHMRDGVAVFDAAGRLVLWNTRFASLSRLPPSLLQTGAPIDAVAAAAWPDTRLDVPARGSSAVATEFRREAEVFEIWRGPMPDGGQVVVLADITRRSQAEAIARQAQKMEALGQLTGGVAHDFNNLLQVVSANLELVDVRLGSDPWLAARVAAALAAVERAARLTRHLLAFARRQPLAPEAIDTRRLLAGLEDMLRRTLGETVALEVVIGGGLWPIRADPQQLENAILNLAINARDAMPGGGKLTIEASNAWLDDAYGRANHEVIPGQYVAIAISDTGHGMVPEQLDRAMEPFFTTKPEGRGTGLGLPMVFGFAKQSRGHFKLYSEPGHGTTARLYLPRSQVAPATQAEAPDVAEPAQGELVLIVEDDATVRAASSQALRGLGYRTLEAGDTATALAMLREGALPDLVFTDIVMPGQPDAPAMAREAQALLPGLAVVFTSGYTENAVVHTGKLDPGVILVSKPWRLADLAPKLRQALDGRRPPPVPPGPPLLRVLLVEDEALVRMTTADLLTDLGHSVTEAATAAEALELLAARPDILVTDVGLPDMDGMELAARATGSVPGIGVVIASGRMPDAGLSAGQVWLGKPYDQAALRAALAAAAASGKAATLAGAVPERPGVG